jgi:hypothetical protein
MPLIGKLVLAPRKEIVPGFHVVVFMIGVIARNCGNAFWHLLTFGLLSSESPLGQGVHREGDRA